MTATHKITNKKNPKNVLYGTIIADAFAHLNDTIFDFRIDGAALGNALCKEEWEVEEILTLPENLFSIIQYEDEYYSSTRTFWRIESDGWHEEDSDYYTDDEILNRVLENAKGKKFKVLFAGVPAEPTEVADEDEGF